MSKNDQEKKKMVVKIGAGGGVGALILLGGALATAALASALIVGRKGRSRREDRHNPPPPPKLQNELDEVNYKKLSRNEAAMNAVESVSAPSLKIEEKKGIESNGETAAGDAFDVQESTKILDSVDPIKQEKEYFPDGSVVIDKRFHFLDDQKFPSETENMMQDVKILITGNGTSEILKETEDFKQVEFDNDRKNGEQNGDGEINEMNPEEDVEITEISTRTKESIEVRCDQEEISALTPVHKALDDIHIDKMEADNNPEMKVNFDQELDGSSSCDNGETGEVKYEAVEENKLDLVADIETGQDEVEATVAEEAFPPMIDSPVTERENVDNVEKSSAVPTEILELSDVVISSKQENEINEEGQEDQIKLVEEELVKEQKDFDQPDEEIVPEKREEVGFTGVAGLILPQTDLQNEVNEDEYIAENEEHDGVGLRVNDEDVPLDSVIYQQKHCDDDDKEEENIMEYEEEANEMDTYEEVEESSIGTRDSSAESNSEAVWPAEEPTLETQQVKLIDQEADRKTLEDKKAQVENDPNSNQVIDKSFAESDSLKTTENSFKKYFVEFKDRPENATKRRILIVALLLVPSYSCSWLFGCSFVKLSLIMLLSMVLSKIHGY